MTTLLSSFSEIPNYDFSQGHLVPSMEATSFLHLLSSYVMPVAIGKVFSPKIAYFVVHSISSSPMHSLDGRDQLLMQESMRMLFNRIWRYLMDGICLLMQDFHTARNCWFLTVVSDIIYKNGEGPVCGNVIFIITYYEMLIAYTYRPCNPQELFNLRHAQARNVIERIFGVLKRRFRILLLGPEYQYSVQAQIPAALCAIHNFIHIHNPGEEDSEISGAEEQYNRQADAGDDVMHSIGFQESTNDAVVARRDRIAAEMWTSYQDILQSREGEDDTEFDSDTEGDGTEYNVE
jgi:hypothetical protein